MTSPLERILTFFDEIGLPSRETPNTQGFLEAVRIDAGQLLFDPTHDHVLTNLLHEAGHIAVTPSIFRPHLHVDLRTLEPHFDRWFSEHPEAFGWPEDPLGRAILQAGEAEAIAWSYAACIHLELDIVECFEKGFDTFDQEDEWVSPALKVGQHFGVSGLAHAGMTDQPKAKTEFSFPKMKRWLQI